jgi:hypothetical protein
MLEEKVKILSMKLKGKKLLSIYFVIELQKLNNSSLDASDFNAFDCLFVVCFSCI